MLLARPRDRLLHRGRQRLGAVAELGAGVFELRAHLAQLGARGLELPAHAAQLGMLLLRASGEPGPAGLLEASTLMYERTASGAEIDFVGPELEVAFEGKYVDRPWRRAAATIRARGGGIFATRTVLDLSDRREENAVWAVPAGMLAWMLASGQATA